jgi:hypothetical protein
MKSLVVFPWLQPSRSCFRRRQADATSSGSFTASVDNTACTIDPGNRTVSSPIAGTPARNGDRAMRKLSVLALVAVAATALLIWEEASATPSIRWVNDDAASYAPPGSSCDNAGYSTIQAAVNAASPGDVINVCPGTYEENVAIATGDLTLMSTGDASVTTVSAAVSFHVFQISASNVTLDGFTILPAGFADGDLGVNVAVEGNSNAAIVHNVITGGRIGVNLGCASAGNTVAQNTINGQTEAGINIDTCEVEPFPGSHDNSVHHNTACSVTSTASIALGGSSDDNSIHHNVATSISVFGTGNEVHHNRTQVAIVDNGSGNTLHHNTTDPNVCS